MNKYVYLYYSEIHDNQLKNISKSLGNLKKLTSL